MKHLLFISIEDLNDWIAPLGGHPDAVTPNMQRLAASGVLFANAHCAAPVCSPSRTATMFSRFPWETGHYTNAAKWFHEFPGDGRTSLIGRLRAAGYTTIGCGKIVHNADKTATDPFPDRADWDAYHRAEAKPHPLLSQAARSGDIGRNADFGPQPEGTACRDAANRDWLLERIAPDARPHVWAFGMHRPHLPFVVPQRFFDMIPEHVGLPPGLDGNRYDFGDRSAFDALPRGGRAFVRDFWRLGQQLQKHDEYMAFVRAYLASVAYADFNLGCVLDRLEAAGLWDDTLIVLWSDHGWQLGEKLAFRKFTLWERALRVPLIFAGGGLAPGEVRAPVSLVDVAPTVMSLLGEKVPREFSGQDLSRTIQTGKPPSRPHAPSVWGTKRAERLCLGISLRTERYRYTRYWTGERELFDHDTDPFEHVNLVAKADGAAFDPITAPLDAEIFAIAASAAPSVGTPQAGLRVPMAAVPADRDAAARRPWRRLRRWLRRPLGRG